MNKYNYNSTLLVEKMRAQEIRGLMEAYSQVYVEPQELTEEQVWEEVETWVNSLLEEGYDLSDYTWEEMYESYLKELNTAGLMTPAAISQMKQRRANEKARGGTLGQIGRGFTRMFGSGEQIKREDDLDRDDRRREQTANINASKSKPAPKPGLSNIPPSEGTGRGGPSDIRKTQSRTNIPPTKPAASATAPKPAAPAAAPKPAAPAATTPAATTPAAKPSAMDQFAKANPKLAASAAERDRTRGTSATTNPLMKDMKSRLPAPKTPSPSTAKTGFDLAKKGVNLAASFDMFDVVKGYLIGEGYADTEEAALAIMTNMSEEWKQSIIEERAPGVKPYTPNRLNPLPKEKPLSGKKGDGSGYGADEKFKKPDDKIEKPGTEVPAPKKGGYGRIFSNIPYGIGAHANRNRSRNSTIRGMDPGAPRSEKLAPTEKKKPSKEIVRKRKDTNESYNIILSYLLDEGYANSVEAAESIMVSMSEDWVLSIIG